MTTHDLLGEMERRLADMAHQPLIEGPYFNGYWRAVADLRAMVAADVTVQPAHDRRASA